MKTFFLFIVAVITVSQAISIFDRAPGEWDFFKQKYGKNYRNNEEDNCRMKIFMENKYKIAKHNAEYEMGLVSFKLGLNKYADLLHHEFVDMLNGFNKSTNLLSKSGSRVVGATFIEPANFQIPESADWRTKGAVTGIKDQGHCGSCWAFSTTGALEGQHFRKTGVLVSLSEQNLIDCSGSHGNNGCNGGLMDPAFQYVIDNNGIDTEKSYPYKGKVHTCRYKPSYRGATAVGIMDIPRGNEEKLRAAVGTVGPVSVAIDASRETFQFYTEGVYNDPKCSSDNLDHGVLVVGYGTDEKGSEYWLVKNSWGKKWGEKGYIKMARNKNNRCGIASCASYPLV